MARGRRAIVFRGPLFRVKSKDWVTRHGDAIRAFFEPIPPIRAAADRIVTEARRQASIVIGVHVRRGDYATFVDGRYFYAHEQYAAVMRSVRELFQGRSIVFLLSSNEPAPEGPYAGLQTCTVRGSVTGNPTAFFPSPTKSSASAV